MKIMDSMMIQGSSFFKQHRWPIFIILFFLVFSYMIISSDYNYVIGDAGTYAKSAKILHETNKIDITGAAPALIGQLFFSNILTHIFGFRLKTLHLSVYMVSFLYLFAMYLLLIELGLNRFLALFGSLTLLINPVSLKLLDWYLSEPFFMFYFIFSLLFFIKGLKQENHIYIYLGGIFCILAVLTRQHAVSLSFTLLLLCIIYRKKIKKLTLIHCVISSILPILAVGLFYFLLSSGKIIQKDVPFAYSSAKLIMMNILANPLKIFFRIYLDSLFFLHYTALYLLPLFLALFFSVLIYPKKVKDFFHNWIIVTISIVYVILGTFYLFFEKNRLMPYIPNISSIHSLKKIFIFTAIDSKNASIILTILTSIGGIMILIKILDYFFDYDRVSIFSKDKRIKNNRHDKRKKTDRQLEKPIDLGKELIFFWSIIYLLLTSFIVLRYDRYIFPFCILTIYLMMAFFTHIPELKKTFIVVFILIYALFIPELVTRGFTQNLLWEASDSLMEEGVPPYEINGGLSFNNYHNFNYILDLYKNVKTRRVINWRKFHPLARYFVTTRSGLENQQEGLELYQSNSKKKFFGFMERQCYVYRRKDGYTKAIWL